MMRHPVILAFTLVSALTLSAATQPIFINNSPIFSPPDLAPQIDATAFLNRSIFNVSTFGTIPFQTQNTLYFTNAGSGSMQVNPGFRFDFFTNNTRRSMAWWLNAGSLSAGTWLLVNSSNIVSTGPLQAGPQGIIRLDGKNIDLTRNGLRTGLSSNVVFGGGDTFGTNYTSPAGVSDLYWGTGTNNMLNDQGQAMRLDAGNFNWPLISSPLHQVIDNQFGFQFTNLVVVGGFGHGAFVYTNRTSPTNLTVQVAFVPTNRLDTNFSAAVRFYPAGLNGGADIAVEFKLTDFDIVTETFNTNSIYIVDHSGFATNIFLARPFFGGGQGRRPNTYEIFRSTPFEFAFGVTNNAVYTNTLLYNPSYVSNAVQVLYAGYAAQVGSATLTNGATPGTSLSDPTNFPGRIEIIGDNVNLDQTRIRAESTVIIKARELSGNKVAKVDAPFLNYNLGSTLPEMVITNLAPRFVQRLFGELAAWSGVWENVEITATSTNFIKFHVLIVDTFFNTQTPVSISEFAATANHLVINDQLVVQRRLQLDTPSINITGGLTLPTASEWSHTNIFNLIDFTNSGVVRITQSANFGADPNAALGHYINSGTNFAASHAIRANNFENSGCVVGTLGVVSLEADTASLLGKPTIIFTNVFTNIFLDPFSGTFFTNVATNLLTNSFGAKLAAAADLDIFATSLSLSNAYLIAGGPLILSVSDSLADAGTGATNFWEAGAGIQVWTLPAFSDLLGTHVASRAPQFVEASHVWPAIDYSATARGFRNNLAIGKLVLDAGGHLTRFRFAGTGPQCAMYVDYLEFRNFATNYLTALLIENNLTIYFANANIAPGKLDGRHGGRLRWVKDFAGPLSSTNITYPSGRTYTFNLALAQDGDLDSDGDDIPNAQDPTPFYTEDNVDLRVAFTNAPARRAVISWFAPADSTTYVEYTTSFGSTDWQTLSVINNNAPAQRLSAFDPIPNTVQQRFYRVRVYPPPL